MIRERYINLFTDFGFKRVFGQEANKDLLIDFLNQVLPKEYQIQDLHFSKNDHVGDTYVDRKAIFDLHCISTNNERFVVELQKAKQQFFKDRTLFYSTFPIVEQAKTGDWNFELSPVFMIGILNFSFNDSKPDKIRHHAMLKDEDCEIFYEKYHIIMLEVNKFNKTLQQCKNRFEKWLWIFKNLPDLEEIPSDLIDDMLSKIFKIAEYSKLNALEKDAYVRSLKYLRDLHNVIDYAYLEGEQDALKKSNILIQKAKKNVKKAKENEKKAKQNEKKAKESEEKAIIKQNELMEKLAKKMLKYNESIEDIIKETGLTSSHIKQLK